jgi:hypothetical protein
MPNLFAKLFLREGGTRDAHDSFPAKQLFILGTSSRSHPDLVCCSESTNAANSTMSPLRANRLYVDISLRLSNGRVLQHHTR